MHDWCCSRRPERRMAASQTPERSGRMAVVAPAVLILSAMLHGACACASTGYAREWHAENRGAPSCAQLLSLRKAAGIAATRCIIWNGTCWASGVAAGSVGDCVQDDTTVVVEKGESVIVYGNASAKRDDLPELRTRFIVSGERSALLVCHAAWEAPSATAPLDGNGGCAEVVQGARLDVVGVTMSPEYTMGHQAKFGGAISGTNVAIINVTASTFEFFSVAGAGGAIFVNESTQLSVQDTVFSSCEAGLACASENSRRCSGGAIYAEDAGVTIVNSTFDDCVVCRDCEPNKRKADSGDVLWLAGGSSISIVNSSVTPAEQPPRTISDAVGPKNAGNAFSRMVVQAPNCDEQASHCDPGYSCEVNNSFSLVCIPCGPRAIAKGWKVGCQSCPQGRQPELPDRGSCTDIPADQISPTQHGFTVLCAIVAIFAIVGGVSMLPDYSHACCHRCTPSTFKYKLNRLPDGLHTDVADRQSLLTVVMMFVGMADLLLELFLCAALIGCGPLEWLLGARVSTLVVTVLCNFYLGNLILEKFSSQGEGGEESTAATRWFKHHGCRATMIWFFSLTRIESMAVLGCRFCGREALPMPDAHFDFLMYQIGQHQYLLADLPHLMVAIALVWIGFAPSGAATNTDEYVQMCGADSLLSGLGQMHPIVGAGASGSERSDYGSILLGCLSILKTVACWMLKLMRKRCGKPPLSIYLSFSPSMLLYVCPETVLANDRFSRTWNEIQTGRGR
jgi:hypothetical protein